MKGVGEGLRGGQEVCCVYLQGERHTDLHRHLGGCVVQPNDRGLLQPDAGRRPVGQASLLVVGAQHVHTDLHRE